MPVITTQKNIGSETYINLIIIFISFSLASSLVYVFNDFFDKNEDIKHPLKKTKPIANKSINLNDLNHEIISIESNKEYLSHRLLEMIIFSDWISYYLAEFNNVDPVPVDTIMKLKNKMA